MDETLRVLWTLVAQDTPRPLRHCTRCGRVQPFHSSNRFRLNANGRRVDAWLIYKCASCDETWNRPLLERRPLAGVAPALLDALCQNDSGLARRVAFDTADLRRLGAALEETSDVTVRKDVVSRPAEALHRLEIRLAVPHPTALRLDRLLARELGLSRTRLHALSTAGRLVLTPDGARTLRRAASDGTCVTLDLAREADAAALATAGSG
ncbi:MAG: DUF1062 domain-containing protein [Bacteroidota bacterium]|nr:DUF1062 domain-containing protein [Kiloniellaceae bacterium]